MSELPPGFELDEESQSNGLPPGFQIDAAASAASPPKQSAYNFTDPVASREGAFLSNYVPGGKYALAGMRYLVDNTTGNPKSYGDEFKGVTGALDQYSKDNPIASGVASTAGALTNPIYNKVAGLLGAPIKGAAGGLLERFPTVARYLGYATGGAGTGGLMGALNAEGEGGSLPSLEDVSKNGLKDAAIGTVTSTAVPAVFEGVPKAASWTAGKLGIGSSPPAGVPTQASIKAASQAAYKASEDAGVIIKPDSFSEFVADLPNNVRALPKTPEAMSVSTPKSYGIMADLKSVADRGEPLTLKALDELRSTASKASMSRDPHDSNVAASIVRHIDDYIEGLNPSHLVDSSVPVKDATDALNNARSLYRTQAKMQTISDIVDTGEMLNDQNWVKGKFRALVKSHSFGIYTPEEQKAIADVAKTGNLEKIIKLIPLRGVQMASTYAEPVAQNMKINSLQGLIARGGAGPAREPLLGSGGGGPLPNLLGNYAGGGILGSP